MSFAYSPLVEEANAPEVENASKPINQTPIGPETTVYIDKIITTRKVASVDVGRVTANGQVIFVKYCAPTNDFVVLSMVFFKMTYYVSSMNEMLNCNYLCQT